MIGVVLFFVGDELLGMLFFAQDMVLDKVSEPLSMGSMLKLEVKTTSVNLGSDIGALVGSVILENDLLKEQESSLMVYILSYLNLRLPKMGCICLFTVITL